MNYSKIYNDLIQSRKQNPTQSNYYEKHHIVPKSMGGNNDKENLIKLTAREHFIAHILLWKIYRSREMGLAVSIMKSENKRYKNKRYFNSKLYESIRKDINESLSGKNSPFFGKTKTKEHVKKISIANTGKKLSDETKKKIKDKSNQYWSNAENREKASNRRKGVNHHTPSSLEKARIAMSGKNNYFYGKESMCKDKTEYIVNHITMGEMIVLKSEMTSKYKVRLNDLITGKLKTSKGFVFVGIKNDIIK